MTVMQASLGIKQRDLARKGTNEGLLLKANDQIQASNVYIVQESWAEANLRVGNLAMNLSSSRGMTTASDSSARKMVELNEEMLCECRAPEKIQICVEVACNVLCTMVVLVLAKIKIDNRARTQDLADLHTIPSSTKPRGCAR